MTSADRFLRGFTQTWHAQQQRLWGGNATEQAQLERAWHQACLQWWDNLHHIVPAALQPQLEAALRQTQLCMRLGLNAQSVEVSDLLMMMNPQVTLDAAISAQRQANAPGTDTSKAEQAKLAASHALMASVTDIAQRALIAIRERLDTAEERTPLEHYEHVAQITEHLYRAQAAGAPFARLIGQWVGAHVDQIAEQHGRKCSTSGFDTKAAPPQAGEQFSTATADTERVGRQMRHFSDKLAAGAVTLASLATDQDDGRNRGQNRGVSANEVVFECDGIKLLRYSATHSTTAPRQEPGSTSEPQRRQPPLLVVYSLINRPYILDLSEQHSLVSALGESGRDVYLIDWGYPDAQDTSLGLDDYVNRYLHGCVTWLLDNSGADSVDLLGICQGGPFALSYTALEPERVRKLALLVAPVDFHGDDFLLSQWLQQIDVRAVVDTLGNIPGHLLNWGFIALKPLSLSGVKALALLDLLDSPEELTSHLKMERWLQDNPDQAGEAFAQFTHTFVRENALVRGGAQIGGRTIDLRAINHDVLNVFAARDHIVPPSASRPIANVLVNAKCTNEQVDCGHVGALAGRQVRLTIAPLINSWFARPE